MSSNKISNYYYIGYRVIDMDNKYFGVYLKIISNNGKCVLEVKSDNLTDLMAINLAFFRFAYKTDFNEECPISLKWNSKHLDNIQDQTVLFRWRVSGNIDKKYLYSGIVKIYESDYSPKTEIVLGDPRLELQAFSESTVPIVKKFYDWVKEDWDVGITLLLFASQIPDHFFWKNN